METPLHCISWLVNLHLHSIFYNFLLSCLLLWINSPKCKQTQLFCRSWAEISSCCPQLKLLVLLHPVTIFKKSIFFEWHLLWYVVPDDWFDTVEHVSNYNNKILKWAWIFYLKYSYWIFCQLFLTIISHVFFYNIIKELWR